MARPAPDIALPWSIGLVVQDARIPAGTACTGTVAHWVLGLSVEGVVRYHLRDGRTLECAAGDILLVRVRVPQHWQVLGRRPWRTIYAVFDPRPHWLPWLDWPEDLPGHARLRLGDGPLAQAVQAALLRAEASWQGGSADANDRAYHAVEEALLLCREHRRSAAIPTGDPLVAAAVELLSSDPDLSLTRLAARCGLSRSQFAHRFARQMGIAPMAWRAQRRLAQARELLHTPFLSVKQVAARAGYRDAKYFSTCFRRWAGVGPLAFRRQLARPAGPLAG